MMRTASRISPPSIALILLLSLLAIAGCSDSVSSDSSFEDFTYTLSVVYCDDTDEHSFYLTDSDGWSVTLPGTYPALYTVTVTDGTSHSTEAMVTVGGNGKVSDVILYANGYRECKYLLTWADSDTEDYWLLTASGDNVTEPGVYTAINLDLEEDDGFEGVFVTERYISTVTINEYGVVSAISTSSDDTDDNKYVYTETYMEGYGTTEESFTDLDGNEVTEDGLYLATIRYTMFYSSGIDRYETSDLTGYVTVSDGEVEGIGFSLAYLLENDGSSSYDMIYYPAVSDEVEAADDFC